MTSTPRRDRRAADEPLRLRRRLRRLVGIVVGITVLAFAAGALFGRADPPRAARLVVAEFTVTEDGPPDAPGPDPDVPVTGPQRGTPVCGPQTEPLAPAQQVETLAAGVVLIQHRPELDADHAATLERLAARDRVATAPSTRLPADVVVVATSWRRRMALDRVDAELLTAFVTGHADRAPAVAPCP